MQPIYHLDSITLLDVCDVQVVLLLNYLVSLNLTETWFLVVE